MASKNRKSYTMQPHNHAANQHLKVINYLRSLPEAQANYENFPRSLEQEVDPFGTAHRQHHRLHHNHHQHHHHQASFTGHSRHYHSHSQSNYGAAMLQPPPNNYYNLPNIEAAFPRVICPPGANHSRHSPPLMAIPHPVLQHKRVQLDSMTVMRLGAELGVTIDAAPEMPPSRNYSISEMRNGQMYKISFPQTRLMATDLSDPQENVFIRKGESVTVLGPSNEDRSKFTICFKNGHIDLPHQYTRRPSIRLGHYDLWQ